MLLLNFITVGSKSLWKIAQVSNERVKVITIYMSQKWESHSTRLSRPQIHLKYSTMRGFYFLCGSNKKKTRTKVRSNSTSEHAYAIHLGSFIVWYFSLVAYRKTAIFPPRNGVAARLHIFLRKGKEISHVKCVRHKAQQGPAVVQNFTKQFSADTLENNTRKKTANLIYYLIK